MAWWPGDLVASKSCHTERGGLPRPIRPGREGWASAQLRATFRGPSQGRPAAGGLGRAGRNAPVPDGPGHNGGRNSAPPAGRGPPGRTRRRCRAGSPIAGRADHHRAGRARPVAQTGPGTAGDRLRQPDRRPENELAQEMRRSGRRTIATRLRMTVHNTAKNGTQSSGQGNPEFHTPATRWSASGMSEPPSGWPKIDGRASKAALPRMAGRHVHPPLTLRHTPARPAVCGSQAEQLRSGLGLGASSGGRTRGRRFACCSLDGLRLRR